MSSPRSTPDTDTALREGTFARKQIFCPARLIAWSHWRRFQTGLHLARRFAGRRVLDYGCGDGTFLALWLRSDSRPAHATGVEIDDRLVEDCWKRFATMEDLSFVPARELGNPAHAGKYEAIICMEVLEHVVAVDDLLEQFDRWLAPGGELLVSVPVETGLPLLVKQTARRVAGWFGVGDYPGTSPYTWSELLRSLVAGGQARLARPIHRAPDGFTFHDHKGFNWMALRARLAKKFVLTRTAASPFLWLTPHLGSQAWFLARKAGP